MARPKGSKNKPKLQVVGANTAGAGHNALSDEEEQSLHLNRHVPEYEKALEDKKTADANFKNVCKRIKLEGGSIDEVKATIALRTPEGELKFKQQMESLAKVARWNGLPIGTQGDMFPTDRRPLAERAAEDGKRSGLAGETLKVPDSFSADPAARDAFIEHWHKGQAVLAQRIKAPEPGAPELLRPEGQVDQGDDYVDPYLRDPEDDAAATAGTDDDAPWPDDVSIGSAARRIEEQA